MNKAPKREKINAPAEAQEPKQHGVRDEKKFRRNMRFCLGIFTMLFIVLIVYLGYTVITKGDEWVATPYNRYMQETMKEIDAGSISDRDGHVLAYTAEDGSREYAEDSRTRYATAHVVGDAMGFSVGAERVYAKYLYGLDKGFGQRVEEMLDGDFTEGSDITLTIDSELSEYIYKQFGDTDGAVVVMNYKTGEILACVSKPSFDATTLGEAALPDTALLNKAISGRYPPGSTMKIVTAAAAVHYGIDMEYECTGECVIDGQKVTCVSNHGTNTLEGAFEKSCNTFFAQLTMEIGADRLSEFAEKFGFNTEMQFDGFTLAGSSFDRTAEGGDLAWAGIGQHKDLVTPLHVCMMVSAIANDGVMVEPQLLMRVGSRDMLAVKEYAAPVSAEEADIIGGYMAKVCTSGTGTKAAVKGHTICGKTGTAEYEEDGKIKNHSWFAAYIDEQEHPYAIAVIGEGAGYGSRFAAPLAGKILSRLAEGKYD